MPTVRVSAFVKAPVEKVFELFTDIEHAPERVHGIKKVDVLSAGPFGLGYRWIETRDVLGRLDDATMEISSFQKNHCYTITHHKGADVGPSARIDTTFTFETVVAGGTRVSIEFEMHPEGIPPAALLPLEWAIGGKVRHVLSDDLQDLKAAVERIQRGLIAD